MIGVQYALTAMVFLLIGFGIVLLMRWQLAYPASPIPLFGALLGRGAPAGIMEPGFYNQLAGMHGTIMVFLGVVPLAVGGFGTYLVPLQIGARAVAFRRLASLAFWLYAAGGVLMLASFFAPGGAPDTGWTAYPPLSIVTPASGQSLWLVGMLLLAASSVGASINMITTIVQQRAPGLSFMRLPFFVWSQLVTAFLLLLAFPPLAAAALMQLMDRLAGTSFFLPSGLAVGGAVLPASGGGNPLLWQHLFWFLAHPEVYVLILPAMGIVAEVLAANIRKPLWGYRLMVKAAIFLGFVSMLVWAHHMFLTGMGTTMSAFFQTTTMIVSIPSVIILSAFFVSLYGGSIRFSTPALFALAFLPMFGLGGLAGLPLGLAASDIHLHDTYYVIGHFHYIVAPGTLFALFAGIYHWFPRVTGRRMGGRLGRVHFWGSLVAMNLIFFPMFIQGLGGLNRRLYDGGVTYAHGQAMQHWHVVQSWAAWGLGVFQLLFLVNLFWSWRRGTAAEQNPWRATTLEWSAPPDRVVRGPYEYSVPGAAQDFLPQAEGEGDGAADYSLLPRPDTGSRNAAIGIGLGLAALVMLFGALFSAYVLLRSGSDGWGPLLAQLDASRAWLGVALLASAAAAHAGRTRAMVAAGAALGCVFLLLRGIDYRAMLQGGITASESVAFASYYLLSGVHAGLVIAGVAASVAVTVRPNDARRAVRMHAVALYWYFVSLTWLGIAIAFFWR